MWRADRNRENARDLAGTAEKRRGDKTGKRNRKNRRKAGKGDEAEAAEAAEAAEETGKAEEQR
jgi:hypothetical protein